MDELGGQELTRMRGWRVAQYPDGRWAVFNGPRERVPLQCFPSEDDAYAFIVGQARQDGLMSSEPAKPATAVAPLP